MIFLKKILLPVIALLFIPSTLFCQNARGIENTVRYEGSVSVGWSWAITLNLETVHGVRFCGSNVFIGGQAGLSFGIPQGVGSYVNVLPRWFFPYSDKLDGYLSLGVGWYNQAGPYRGSSEPPSVTAGRKNYAGMMLTRVQEDGWERSTIRP